MSPTPRVTTDWRGRAIMGRWWGDYYMDWRDHNDRKAYDPGNWCVDEHGRDWWVTGTPEWDRAWFAAHHVKPPKRIGDKQRTEWVDEGGGLSSLGYKPPKRGWWAA
ncbi:hypothetical protein [Nocardia africana]